MIPYAHFLLDRGWPSDVSYVHSHLYKAATLREAGSVIKNDLEEVGGGWWQETFDLWEEVYVLKFMRSKPDFQLTMIDKDIISSLS
jgi:hypothetical protein